MNWWILKRQVHISWLIAAVSVGCVAGVMMARFCPAGMFFHIVWLVVAVTLMAIAVWLRYVLLVVFCIIGGVLVGLWRGSASWGSLAVYEQFVGITTSITGTVQEDVDQRPDGTYVLRLGSLQYEGTSLPGVAWVTVADASHVQRSDSVTVRGKITKGFGTIAITLYRATITGVQRPQPGDQALAVRNWFSGAVRSGIDEPQASLGLGFLLGQRRSLPPELGESLRIAGLTHVIVASGYNLTILVRLARRLFMRISRFTALAAALGMVVSFIAITGMSPSMSRAGLVAGLSLLAWYYGRTIHPLVLLPLAAAVTVLVNPSYAWGDIGWQLSFAAFAGVMILAPLMQAYFFGDKKPGTLRQILGETIAAQIATLPILLVTFGEVSNVAIIANVLVLPLVPLAMLLTFAAGVGALILPVAATAWALPAQWLLGYMTTVTQWIAGVPWALSMATVAGWFMVLFYGLLAAACWYMGRITGYRLGTSNITE